MDGKRDMTTAAAGPDGSTSFVMPVAGPAQGAVRTRLYRDAKLLKEDFPPEEISDELRQRHGCIIWVDLCQPNSEQLEAIGREFGLHELAIEDALEETPRTKLDRYDTHLFMSAYSVRLNVESAELETQEIAAFITHHALITVRKEPGFDMGPVIARWDSSGDLAQNGVSFLLYGLLDHLVDGHFRAVEALDQAVEETEEGLFDTRTAAIDRVLLRSFQLRKSLVLLRRITLPTREVVNTLLRHDVDIVPEPMVPYFRDTYDHVIRTAEWTESLRDLVTSITETEQANRTNVVMKKVTSWAAIIAVPTLVTGWYGQNVPYPTSGKTAGVISSAVLIVVLAAGLFVLFRRKKWL
jgi:magnesium transporter